MVLTPTLVLIVATFCSVALGVLWYSPLMFGGQWAKEISRVPNDLSQGMVRRMVIGAVLFFCMFYGIAHLLRLVGDVRLITELLAGIFLVCVPLVVSIALWERRTISYMIITVLYYVSALVGGALLIVYWPW